MKGKVSILLVAITAILFSGTPSYASDSHGGSNGSHGTAMSHEGHGGEEGILVGEETVEGVKAMAHVKDVMSVMAQLGKPETHHLMLFFTDTATGERISEGTAAVKVTDPSGETRAPARMMAMEGHFGIDLALSEPGGYSFEIGTYLPDRKKRQYTFQYEIK